VWDVIHKDGLILFNNPGCMENVFTSEDCLKQLGCSLSDAKRINQICGGVVGFNRHNQKAMRVFNRMMELSRDGISFQGGRNTSSDPKFHSHRHDQSCLSYLAVTHGLRVQPFNWVRYSYDSRGLDGCIIELRGMYG
jgi:hypothetical protein